MHAESRRASSVDRRMDVVASRKTACRGALRPFVRERKSPGQKCACVLSVVAPPRARVVVEEFVAYALASCERHSESNPRSRIKMNEKRALFVAKHNTCEPQDTNVWI